MTWLFSQALMDSYENSRCLQDQAEEYSEENCSDGGPFALLNVMPTPHKFWFRDKMMDVSSLSRFGLTCAVLTASHGEGLLTWFRAGFPVKTSALQEKAPVLPEAGQDCGLKWPGLFAMFNRDLCLWKIPHYSLLGDSDTFSQTWPRSGLMRNGLCYQLPTSAHHIYAREYGLLPTPVASEAGAGVRVPDGKRGPRLTDIVKRPDLWPTPIATNTKANHLRGADKGKPRKARNYLATPTARDWKSGKASKETIDKNSRPLSEQVGGQLNPTWVEWLMGWPIGWTDLEPLAMDRFQEWLNKHGKY